MTTDGKGPLAEQLSYVGFADEQSTIPVVCVVVEGRSMSFVCLTDDFFQGGTHTIRMVLEHVTDTPPVPVVVCDGSGRSADLIAFAHRYAREDGFVAWNSYVSH